MSDLILMKDARKVTEVSLPSFPGSKVSMYQDLLIGEVRRFNDIKDPFDKAIEIMIASTKDWNLAEEVDDGNGGTVVQKIAITKAIVDKMPQEDIMLLLATSQGISVEELKERGQKAVAEKKSIVA
jgi:hypothetical protein